MKKWILLVLSFIAAYCILLVLETKQVNEEKDEIIVFLASKGFSDLELDVLADTPKLCAPFDRPYKFNGNMGATSVSGVVCKSNHDIKFELNKE